MDLNKKNKKDIFYYGEQEEGIILDQSENLVEPISTEAGKNPFLTIKHGRLTDAMPIISGKSLKKDAFSSTGSASLEVNGVTLKIDQHTQGIIRPSTHKLLMVMINQFVSQNHTGKESYQLRNTYVQIPLEEYAEMCGYDVKEKPTQTPEDAKLEKKRVKNNLDNARKKVKKDLDILFRSYWSWTEKIKGENKNFLDVRLITAKGIVKKGLITMEFHHALGEYLLSVPMGKYPRSLLKVDERNKNAYSMGYKMSVHYGNINNQKRGTAQILKVKTLLNVTDLPDIEKVRKQRASWEKRIKEPFEEALEALRKDEYLSYYYYSYSKGKRREGDEAVFNSYEDWADALVYFVPTEPLTDIPSLPDIQ